MKRVSGWLDEHSLQLATQKLEIVVLTKKRINTLFPMTVLGENIRTKEAVKYLGITLDTKITLFSHIQDASAKAARVTTSLSGLMSDMSSPNRRTGGLSCDAGRIDGIWKVDGDERLR